MSAKRQKLETQIEKQLHNFVEECREHAVDYAVLAAKKKHRHLDREQMSIVLDLLKEGTSDGYFQGIDRFMKKLDAALTEYTDGEENPLEK